MKVERHKNEHGEARCISFSNTWASRWGARRVARSIPGVVDAEPCRLFGNCEFYKFELNSIAFVLNEDWGDSSVFDICCDQSNTKELEIVASHFEKYRLDPIKISFWLFLTLAVIGLFNDLGS